MKYSPEEERLIQARERFFLRFAVYPGVMWVGASIFATVNPAKHPAWAIESTLVLEDKKLPARVVVMVKPPEVRKAA